MNKKLFSQLVPLVLLILVTACSQNAIKSPSPREAITSDNVEKLVTLAIIDDSSPLHLSGFEFNDNGDLIIALDHEQYDSLEACEVVVWETDTGAEKARELFELNALMSAAFHPNETQVALGGSNSAVYLWDFESGETTLLTEGIPWSHGGSMTLSDGSIVEMVPVSSLAFSPDGAILAVGYSEGWGHSTVELYDMTKVSQQEVSEPYWTNTITKPGWLTLAFHPNEMILMGSYYNVIYLWDPITGKLIDQHFLNNKDPYKIDLAYAQDGKIIITSTIDQTSYWDSQSFEELDMLDHLSGLKAINFDASIMAVSGDKEIQLWDIATEQLLKSLDVTGRASTISFSPNGTILAIASPDGKIHLWGLPGL